MSGTRTPLLSDRLEQHADTLLTLAKAVAALDERLGTHLAYCAASAGLMHLGARTLERDLRTARCTADALAADATAEAALPHPCAATIAAMDQRNCRARTIAAILGPVLARRTGAAA
jgi:hypothetical protein